MSNIHEREGVYTKKKTAFIVLVCFVVVRCCCYFCYLLFSIILFFLFVFLFYPIFDTSHCCGRMYVIASMYSYNKYITYIFVCVCFLRMLLLRSGRDAYTNAHGSDRCQPSRYSWTWLKMPLSSVASGRYGKQMRMYKPATVLYKLVVYRISILFCI